MFDELGAFAWTAGSSDAAFMATLEGPHTVHTLSTDNGTVLVEVYDAGAHDHRKLTNLSARYKVGTGTDVLIAGFVVAGTGTKQVLIRVIGPTLARYGVPDTLADPQLAVYEGQTPIAHNDNWDTTLAPTFRDLGAFDLPNGSKDAALVVTLSANRVFTVHASGVDGGTGEALVELYAVP